MTEVRWEGRGRREGKGRRRKRNTSNSSQLLSTYYMLGAVLSTLLVFTDLIVRSIRLEIQIGVAVWTLRRKGVCILTGSGVSES